MRTSATLGVLPPHSFSEKALRKDMPSAVSPLLPKKHSLSAKAFSSGSYQGPLDYPRNCTSLTVSRSVLNSGYLFLNKCSTGIYQPHLRAGAAEGHREFIGSYQFWKSPMRRPSPSFVRKHGRGCMGLADSIKNHSCDGTWCDKLTGPRFCSTANERVYITASGGCG